MSSGSTVSNSASIRCWMRRVSARAEGVLPKEPASFIHAGHWERALAVLSLSSRASVNNCVRLVPRETAMRFARRSVVPEISIVVFTTGLYHIYGSAQRGRCGLYILVNGCCQPGTFRAFSESN